MDGHEIVKLAAQYAMASLGGLASRAKGIKSNVDAPVRREVVTAVGWPDAYQGGANGPGLYHALSNAAACVADDIAWRGYVGEFGVPKTPSADFAHIERNEHACLLAYGNIDREDRCLRLSIEWVIQPFGWTEDAT